MSWAGSGARGERNIVGNRARLIAPSRTARTLLLRARETVRLSLQVDCDFKESSEPLPL